MEERIVKKFVSIIIALVLSLTALTNARATEITGDMSNVWWANINSNGKVSAASWELWNYENQKYDNYVAFNFDGKDDGWTEPVVIPSDYFFDIEVLTSGKIVFAYLDNEVAYLQTTTDGNNFSDPTELSLGSGMRIESDYELEIESLGKIVTLVAEVRNDESVQIFSWTSNKNLTAWTKKVVTNDVFPARIFSECTTYSYPCYHAVRNLRLGQNSKGQQTLVARVFVSDDDTNPATDHWANFAFQRKTPTSNWKAPQMLDSFGPEEVDRHAYQVSQVVVTPKGKAAWAYTKGFNDDPDAVQIFVSSGFGKAFKLKDHGTLSSVYGTGTPTLVNVGEKFYTAFNKNSSEDELAQPDVYVGEVGKLNKAKRVGTAGTHRMFAFTILNGKFTMVSESESNGKYIIQLRKLSKNMWSQPVEILAHPNGYGVSPWESGCDYSPKLMICSAPVLPQPFDPNQWPAPVGLNVEIVK
jgi:hypothetical protein